MVEKNGIESLERLKREFTETEKVILSRRSVRQYKKEQVPEFMVKRILEAGRFAPSAGNFPAMEVHRAARSRGDQGHNGNSDLFVQDWSGP